MLHSLFKSAFSIALCQGIAVLMSLLKCVHIVSCRLMRFIDAKENSGPRNPDAAAKVELTERMIKETGAQFGVDLNDAKDLLAMRKTMSRIAFADWVYACGYLQIVQNALAKGTYEDRTNGLWKQALVHRCVTC